MGPDRPTNPHVGKIIIVAVVIVIAVAAVLASIPRPPTTSPTAELPETMYFTAWKDPKEHAFTMLTPKGWNAQGGTERYYYPFLGPDFNVTIIDASGKMSIFFSTAGFPIFIEPSPSLIYCVSPTNLLTYIPCTEGTWWLPPGYIGLKAFVHGYLTARNYAQQIWLPSLEKDHPDAKIVTNVENSDLVKRMLIVEATEYSGADTLFSYTEGGQRYKYGLQVLVTRISIPALGYRQWSTYVWGYSAPENDFDKGINVARLYSMIVPTVRINLQWLQNEILRQADAQRLIQQHFQIIRDMDYAWFRAESESNARIGEGWANALGGTLDVKDPDTGDLYKVPNVFDYYWRNRGTNDIVGTTTHDSPSGPYTELTILKP